MTAHPNDRIRSKAVDTGKSVHLSASAGSGKTRALKERYIALLDELDRRGLAIDQAVAITFTDKAAAEIKERVMRDLPEPMLKKIIRGRQDLRISTIHSFCMNLLKRYPLEAGLPPDFGVIDTRDQAARVRQAVDDALEESDRSPDTREPLRGFTADELVELLEFLFSIRSRLKRLEIDAGGPSGLAAALRRGMAHDAAEQELRSIIEHPDAVSAFLRMERLLSARSDHYADCGGPAHAALARTKDRDEASRTAFSLAPVYFTLKGEPRRRPYLAKPAYVPTREFPYAEYEELFFRVQEALRRMIGASGRVRAAREALGILLLFQRADDRYREATLRDGLLDFDDLEIYAYRLLRSVESPEILYWLDRKILHFLVDEFQDTSDIQWAVVNALTEELFSGAGADKPMPSTLFVVGDEKQSIYRFREANYRLIELVRRRMESQLPSASREILTLKKNFRSAPAIIETVNRVFSFLWGDAYEPSEPDRASHAGTVRLLELSPPSADDGAPLVTEAGLLARELAELVERGTPVYERTATGWAARPAGFGDCTVLIQSRTRLKEYETALQAAAIPYRVVGGIGFYEEDEIQALVNVLFFLRNRDDRLALAAALRSALFGLSDRDILLVFAGATDPLSRIREHWPGISRDLEEWGRAAGVASLGDLLHRIIRDRAAYFRFGRITPQALFNIDKLLDTAREFDRRGYTTLEDFVEWIRNIRATEHREATADLNLPGFLGAVSIMTVHKAKGLEFPIVFLPGMNQASRALSLGPRALIEEQNGGVRMAIRDGAETYRELWERERAELARENQRLLYVAMTRARDHLVMIGTAEGARKACRDTAWLGSVRQALGRRDDDVPSVPCLVTSSYPHWRSDAKSLDAFFSGGEGPRREPAPQAIVPATVIENLSPLPAPRAPEWKAATDFIEEEVPEEKRAPSPEGISPLVRGSVLHRCLEELTKTGSGNLDAVTGEFPDLAALGLEARNRFREDVEGVVRNVTGKSDLAWIFERRAGSYSELPFLYRRGHDIVSGVIDRVVVRGRSAAVIDYKALLVENDESLKFWKNHYLPQLRVYCEAVRHLFAAGSVEGYLLFLDNARLESVFTL